MEPRTRILFISYIVIVLAIVAIGVVPYYLQGQHDVPQPAAVGLNTPEPRRDGQKRRTPPPMTKPRRPDRVGDAQKQPPASDGSNYISKIHVIDTNKLTHSVRFQIPTDGVYFEEQNERLYEIMKDKNGLDILLSYQKISKDNEVLYNFSKSTEIR